MMIYLEQHFDILDAVSDMTNVIEILWSVTIQWFRNDTFTTVPNIYHFCIGAMIISVYIGAVQFIVMAMQLN